MMNSTQLRKETESKSSLRRDVVMAWVVVTMLLSGVAFGGATAPQSGQQATAARQATAPQPKQEFIYFPSQYVNQATEPSEHIQAF